MWRILIHNTKYPSTVKDFKCFNMILFTWMFNLFSIERFLTMMYNWNSIVLVTCLQCSTKLSSVFSNSLLRLLSSKIRISSLDVSWLFIWLRIAENNTCFNNGRNQYSWFCSREPFFSYVPLMATEMRHHVAISCLKTWEKPTTCFLRLETQCKRLRAGKKTSDVDQHLRRTEEGVVKIDRCVEEKKWYRNDRVIKF